MLFGHLPFEGSVKPQLTKGTDSRINWTPANVYQLYEHIMSNPIELPASPLISKEAASLVRRLLDPDPYRRLTMEQVRTGLTFLRYGSIHGWRDHRRKSY